MTKAAAEARLEKLREEINHHRYRYHVKDSQEISEAALDSLKAELAALEAEWPELITSDSPSQRVAGTALPQFEHVTHRTRMLSLTDVFSLEELRAWEKRNQKIIPARQGEARPDGRPDIYGYFCELKIDGVAVSLVYENGQLVYGATRGDGFVGENVTHNIRTIESIPLQLRQKHNKRVEVRGEVYMRKEDFERLNEERKKANQPLYANPRNFSAGSIRQLDPKMAASRPLKFFAWEITEGRQTATRAEEYHELQELGFPVPPDAVLRTTIDEVGEYLKTLEAKKEHYPFLVDGAVVKVNNLAVSARLGIVGKAPRGSVAYKFAAEEATTTVEDIIVQVGRTGALTPVAILKPVAVAGTVVSRATLHNADEIRRKDIRLGDTVIIHKAGDIIPEIVQSLPKLRPVGAQPWRFPTLCPVCGSATAKDPDGVVVRCTNKNCWPVQRERILHATGRAGFDIEGLGEKIVDQLLQEGLIKDTADLWQLTEGDLLPLERFAETSAKKLIQQIQGRKKITLSRFLVALSIPHIGVVTAQDLSREFRTLAALRKASLPRLQGVAGIGEKIAQSVYDFFQSAAATALLKKYRAVGIALQPDASSGPLQGKTFLFTGTLPDITRDEAKQQVLALGGKVASSLGRQVDYLVVGDDAGSKAEKARQLQITQLTPAEFRQMIQL